MNKLVYLIVVLHFTTIDMNESETNLKIFYSQFSQNVLSISVDAMTIANLILSSLNRKPTRGSSTKGSHVYFLLTVAMVLLL